MKRPPGRPAPVAPRRDPRKLAVLAGSAVALLVAAWLLWPSAASRVANLSSPGSTIVAFGDSLTFGYGANPGEDYPSRLGQRIGATIFNAGVSGDTTEGALARIDADVLSKNPRIVIVGLGGNDYLRSTPIATTEQNLRAIIRRIRDARAMVVLLGFEFPSLNANYGAMYERVAEEEKCLLVPDLLAGILRDPALKSDEIHPNARGYELMAERVEEPLRELIDKADASR